MTPALLAVLSLVSLPKSLPQGGIVEIRIASDTPLAGVVLVDGDARVPLERDASGRAFRGLYGVDLDAKTGEREITFQATEGEARLDVKTRVTEGRFRTQRISVDPRYVEVPPEERARVEADGERVRAAYASAEAARRWSAFARPVAFQGSHFGSRRVYNGKTTGFHAGLDMAAPKGTPVAAAADGRVALAGDLYFSGGTVLLDHGGGLFTQYMHLSRVDVKEGEVLRKGAIVGLVGATGRATGPHLHWGARWNGARVNPLALVALPRWPAPPAAP